MKTWKQGIIGIAAAIIFVLSTTCATSPAISGGSSKPEGPAFTGDGGKGKSIAIIAPRAAGLAENQNYIPALVQGELVSNFTSYSAITVLDRMRLDEQYKELLSGYYSDNASQSWDLGHLNPTGYLMLGTVTRTGSGYALQISITDNTNKSTVASYSATITAAELDNLSGVRKASLDLMQKMGVAPTERTRVSLSGAAAASEANAQRALSQGIAAQKGGNEFQAMINYFEARTFDPTIPEASARTTRAQTTLAANNGNNSGSARASVMSEIERRKEAIRQETERKRNIEAVLDKATAFYKAHQPYQVLLYDTFIYAIDNYDKSTVVVNVGMRIAPIAEEFRVIKELEKLAKSIGYNVWPYKHIHSFSYFASGWFFPKASESKGIWKKKLFAGHNSGYDETFYITEPEFTVTAVIVNEQGKQIGRMTARFRDKLERGDFMSTLGVIIGVKRRLSQSGEGYEFKDFTINVDDLTDTMTMRIVSVNGRSVDSIRRSGYVRIPRESAVLKAAGAATKK